MVLAWIAVIVWAVLIFAASAKSGLDFDTGNGPLELARRWLADVLSGLMGYPVDPSPIGHFCEYLVFGALLSNALRMHQNMYLNMRPSMHLNIHPSKHLNMRMRPSRVALCAIAIAAAYAATDEFHQMFVPGRSCDPVDWLVDVAAATISACIFAVVLNEANVVDAR